MKQFWHEFCIHAYLHRFEIWALLLVSTLWFVLAEWIIPRNILDLVIYISFGWFVLGKIFVPWTERKLKQLFD